MNFPKVFLSLALLLSPSFMGAQKAQPAIQPASSEVPAYNLMAEVHEIFIKVLQKHLSEVKSTQENYAQDKEKADAIYLKLFTDFQEALAPHVDTMVERFIKENNIKATVEECANFKQQVAQLWPLEIVQQIANTAQILSEAHVRNKLAKKS